MEQKHIDIEAHIRQAQKQRAQAQAELLAAGWNKCVQMVSSLAQRRLKAHIVAARSHASAIY
ncbi:MAG: hypothetical protein KJ614_06385 [Gammaproteobacteria bacterium]|nr:hypothetical protein [Gammaproteobacteria bacterium]MBU3997871.1 hypothetical protein [Gammaproteobacteria bacterium]MBU4079319.1 hypothetical protein [Gammaproteobacteria bacterium]MBU4171247.1 hypothetical protein [Gammaproteobacteria bacterium]